VNDLQLAQQRLGAALAKAQAGEDRDLAHRIRDEGIRFVQVLTALLRMTRVHALDNQAFAKPLEEFQRSLVEMTALLGAVHVVTVEQQVYVNDVRLRLDSQSDQGLSTLLKRHRMGGISFHGALTRNAIHGLLSAFAEQPAASAPRRTLGKRLQALGITNVELFGTFRFRDVGDDYGRIIDAEKALAQARRNIDDAWENLSAGRIPNPLPLRRSITEILEGGLRAEGVWDGGSRSFDRHCTRVARVALILGEAIGLSDAQLQDLGVTALMHDVGYSAREGAVEAEDGQPHHPGYPPPFARHGASGLRVLMRQRGFHEARVHRMLAVLEHHRDFDGERMPSLFGRILRIAEDFDNYSTSKVCKGSPALALRRMKSGSASAYDPLLLQALINRLGAYPPGTLLRLVDGRVLQSTSLCRGPSSFAKPLCRVLYLADGCEPLDEIAVDLLFDGQVQGLAAFATE
jgi:HD-GYP domain-containing protein (c-di-GMP phosphodiesterase class II)